MDTYTHHYDGVPLDKDMIKALRKADRVTFHYWEGKSIIRAHHKCTCGCDCDAHIDIAADLRIDSYGREDQPVSCYEMEHSPQYHLPFLTFLRALRVGDQLRLFWTASEGNGYLSGCKCTMPDLGYHDVKVWMDSLSIVIQCKGKDIGEYHVRSSVCPDNTARMVRFPTTM